MKNRTSLSQAFLPASCADAAIGKSLHKLPYDRFFRVAIAMIATHRVCGPKHPSDLSRATTAANHKSRHQRMPRTVDACKNSSPHL